jgi:hypothetical protein
VANDSITLGLSGEVSLDQLAAAVKDLSALIAALSDEVGGKDKPEWVVEYMEGGSATLTFAGQAAEEETVERIVRAYAVLGQSLESGEPPPYSRKVEAPAKRITSLLNGSVTAVRFETPEETSTVVSPSVKAETQQQLHAYGAVEGRIQTLTSRGGLRFVLYDSLFGKAVYCYLDAGGEDMMRGAWDRRAVVEGWVSREPVTGRPVSIRKVTRVRLLDEIERGSYRKARGAVPLADGEPTPEETLRQLRDAS